MNDRVKQSDWKHFKVVRERALERLCKRTLDDLVETASDESSSYHERYLRVFRKIKDYDGQIAAGFNGLRRSRMIQQIARSRSEDLISDDEMEGFTQETQDSVERFLDY